MKAGRHPRPVDPVGLSQPTASHHIKQLVDAGLGARRAAGPLGPTPSRQRRLAAGPPTLAPVRPARAWPGRRGSCGNGQDPGDVLAAAGPARPAAGPAGGGASQVAAVGLSASRCRP
nr:winged helix-turn-helix domain-containing protein [Nocardioides litoris]